VFIDLLTHYNYFNKPRLRILKIIKDFIEFIFLFKDFIALCRAVPAFQLESPSESKQHDTSEEVEKRKPNQPLCLVVEPTKELAQQTYTQINKFMKYLDNPKIKFFLTFNNFLNLFFLEMFLL